MSELIEQLQTAKRNVQWLLDHESGLVDMHGLAYWARVVERLRTEVRGWFDAAFRKADAIWMDEDGLEWIDEAKVPASLVSCYRRFIEYGYANGLMP